MKNTIQENDKTLLGRFINEKVRQYLNTPEPSREGTPKGDPIGFSRVKYRATLYSLTNIKQKEVAERLGVSHGLIRNWNTEKPFKAMVESHCKEFAEIFIKNIHQKIKQRESLQDTYFSQPFKKIVKQNLPSLGYDEISDANKYSDIVQLYILNALSNEAEKAITPVLSLQIYGIFDALRVLWGVKKSECVVKSEKEVRKKILKALVDKSAETLLKPVLSEDDKKQLLITIKTTSGSIG